MPTPTSDDDSYFSKDNYGGGKIPENKKRKASEPIVNNNKKKKQKREKREVQLSLIFPGTEKVEEAPLHCSKMMLLNDDIYRKRIPEEYKGHLCLYMVPSMIGGINNSQSSIRTE